MPIFALLICVIFIFFLFWTDKKRKERFCGALWIPFLWMFFSSGRTLVQWLYPYSGVGTENQLAASLQEGNALNMVFFLVLIVAGAAVLSSRKEIDWRGVWSGNKLIWLYLFYCLLSAIWSPFSFISFKRWVKELGSLVMVMVILSEEHPLEALEATLRRLTYLWLPLSVLFIKYYPALGRVYTEQGIQTFTGIGTQKNELGALCLISCIYYGWYFILRRRGGLGFEHEDNRRRILDPAMQRRMSERQAVGYDVLDVVLVAMLLWLFRLSRSATSLVCVVIAVGLFLAARASSRKPERVMSLAAIGSLSFFVLDATTGVWGHILHFLGRKPNLTDRTLIWAATEKIAGNHWVGVGYQSFWLGDRLKETWESIGGQIIQAHNGYLEQYLNLGYIGVAFIIALMLLGLLRVRKLLASNDSAGMLMFCFIMVIALYNYTEASFYAINNLWLLFIFAVVELPRRANRA